MSIIEVLVTSTLVSGLVAALVATLLGLWRDKNLEKFKDDLRAGRFRFETKFASWHEQRAEVVAELYQRIVVALGQIDRASLTVKPIPKTDRQTLLGDTLGGRVYKASSEVNVYFKLNHLYFTKDQIGTLDKITMRLNVAAWVVTLLQFEDLTEKFVAERREELDQGIEELRELREILEESFKDALGAELES